MGTLLLLVGALVTTAGGAGEMTKNDALRAAKEALVQAGVPGQDGRVVSASPVTWPDARLGCGGAIPPSPAPVTGYRVVLQVAQRVYRVHVVAGVATICGSPLEVAPAEPLPDGDSESGPVVEASDSDVEALVAQAKADLAAALSVAIETIDLVKFREVVWPDSSLGCPQPGLLYTQALAPGYRIGLRAGGRPYEYHGARGGKPFRCSKSPASS